jgi:hypothetical protein
MARFDYARLRTTAERLIEKFGQVGALRRKGVAGATSPWNPAAAPESDYPITFVLTNYSIMEKANSLIQRSDRRAYISTKGVSITPSVGDQLVIGATALAIMNISPLSPGDVVMFWEAQVRM